MKRRFIVSGLGSLALFFALEGAALAIPNPSSVFCKERGGTSVIVSASPGAGQSSLCLFSDGAAIEEWTLFYLQTEVSQAAEAFKAGGSCAEKGGTIKEVTATLDAKKTYRLCRFSDRSTIDVQTLEGGAARYPVFASLLEKLRP